MYCRSPAAGSSTTEENYVYFSEENLNLTDFPEEVILYILSFLHSPRDLAALSLTSRQFKRVANTPCLWLPFCRAHRYFHAGLPAEDARLLYSRLEKIESNVKENVFVVETTHLPSDAFYVEFSHNALCMARGEGIEIYNLDTDTLERKLKLEPPDGSVVKEINTISNLVNTSLVDLYEQKISEYAAFLELQKLIPTLQDLLCQEFIVYHDLCTIFHDFPKDFDELQAKGGIEFAKQSCERMIHLLIQYMSHQVGITGGVVSWEKLNGSWSIEIESNNVDVNSFSACDDYLGMVFSDGFYEVWDRHTGRKIMSGQTEQPITALYFFRDGWRLYDNEAGWVSEINLSEQNSILIEPIHFYKPLDERRVIWVDDSDQTMVYDIRQKQLLATYERKGNIDDYFFDSLNEAWQAWSIEGETGAHFLEISDLENLVPTNQRILPIPPSLSIEAAHGLMWLIDLDGELSRLDPYSLEKEIIIQKNEFHFKMGWYREKLYIYHFNHGMTFFNFAATSSEIEGEIAALNAEQKENHFSVATLARNSANSKRIEKNGAKRRRLQST